MWISRGINLWRPQLLHSAPWNKQELVTWTLVTFEGLGQKLNSIKGYILIPPSPAMLTAGIQGPHCVFLFLNMSVPTCSLPIFLLSFKTIFCFGNQRTDIKTLNFLSFWEHLTLNQVLLLPAPFIMIMYYTKLKMARRKLLGWCLNALN